MAKGTAACLASRCIGRRHSGGEAGVVDQADGLAIQVQHVLFSRRPWRSAWALYTWDAPHQHSHASSADKFTVNTVAPRSMCFAETPLIAGSRQVSVPLALVASKTLHDLRSRAQGSGVPHLKYRLAVPTASSDLESELAMAPPSNVLAAGASVATTTAWDAQMVCPPSTLTRPGCPGMGPVTDSTLVPAYIPHFSARSKVQGASCKSKCSCMP